MKPTWTHPFGSLLRGCFGIHSMKIRTNHLLSVNSRISTIPRQSFSLSAAMCGIVAFIFCSANRKFQAAVLPPMLFHPSLHIHKPLLQLLLCSLVWCSHRKLMHGNSMKSTLFGCNDINRLMNFKGSADDLLSLIQICDRNTYIRSAPKASGYGRQRLQAGARH